MVSAVYYGNTDDTGTLVWDISPAVEYEYNTQGYLHKVTNESYTTTYSYDFIGRTVATVTEGENRDYYAIESKYDEINRVTELRETIGEKVTATEYSYNETGEIDGIYLNRETPTDEKTISYEFDELMRLKERALKNGVTVGYTYLDTENNGTTSLVETMTIGEDTYKYAYDQRGNITSIHKNNELLANYYYDTLNQLIKEENLEIGRQIEYTYDGNGNILNRREDYLAQIGKLQGVTAMYDWEYTDSTWTDLLTKFNGQTITYDEIGNPLSYRDGMNFTW